MSAPDISQVVPPQPMPDVSTPAPVPVLAGSPGSPQAQAAQNRPPTPSPILYQLIRGLVHPQQIAPAPGEQARPVSRLATFETFLGDFVNALGHGLSQAHGYGAFAKGAGAAMTAPYDTAVQQFQMGQQAQAQQAAVAGEQAKTELTQAQTGLMQQSVPVTLPNGQQVYIPASQLGQYYKGGFAAGVNAQAKLTTEQLKLQAQQGQVARVLPGIDPQSNQPAMLAYDKQNRLVGVVPGAFNPATLPKVSTSQQWLETSPGVWDLVDKTSTTRTVVPGASPSGFPRAGGPTAASAPAPTAAASSSGAPQFNNVPKLNPRGGRRIVGDVPGIALDPQSGELLQTTSAEAAQKGYQNFQKASGPEFDKYRSAQAQFNDVQTNTSRYTAAAQRAMREPLSAKDLVNIHSIMNTKGLYDFNVAISEGGHIDLPLLGGFTEGASRAEKSGAYQSLSPQAKDLIDGYFRTVSSVPAYMKALTNVGKFNKEQMELEIQNIPNPTMGASDIARKLSQWQENIDAGSSSIPRMKGMMTIRDVRNKFEGTAKFSQPSADDVRSVLQSLTGGAR